MMNTLPKATPKRTTALALSALLALAPTVPTLAATPWPVLQPVQPASFAKTIQTATETVTQSMESHGIKGMSVALVDASTGFSWTAGFGYADTTTGAQVNEHTLFQIGSVSKPFTAIAVMQLVEQGLIELDTPIVYYLPEFSMLPNPITGVGDSSQITVRHLLSNTGGIHDYIYGLMMTGDAPYQGAINNLLPRLASREMVNEPGTFFDYTNLSWSLLGILVARVTGQDNYFEGFATHAHAHVLAPLGMARSTFVFSPELANVSMGYTDADTQADFSFMPIHSAGGLLASAHDMGLFMHALLGDSETVLARETIRYMMQNHTYAVPGFQGAVLDYGLGFMVLNLPMGVFVGHGGATINHHTEMLFSVEHQIGVFVSTNTTSGIRAATPTALAILLAAVAEQQGIDPTAAAETVTTSDETTADATDDPIPVDVSPEMLADFVAVFGGYFDFAELGVWEITLVDGVLVSRHETATLELVLMSDNSLVLAGLPVPAHYTFELVGGEPVFTLHQAGMTFVGVPSAGEVVDQAPALAIAPFVGSFLFVPQFPSEVPNVYRLDISITDSGRVMFQQHTRNQGSGPILPLSYINGRFFMAHLPLLLDVVDGMPMIDFLGGRFVLEGQ